MSSVKDWCESEWHRYESAGTWTILQIEIDAWYGNRAEWDRLTWTSDCASHWIRVWWNGRVEGSTHVSKRRIFLEIFSVQRGTPRESDTASRREACWTLVMLLHPTFPVNSWVSEPPEEWFAAIFACSLIHGIYCVPQETFWKSICSRWTILSTLRQFKEFGIVFLRIEANWDRQKFGTGENSETRTAGFYNTDSSICQESYDLESLKSKSYRRNLFSEL